MKSSYQMILDRHNRLEKEKRKKSNFKNTNKVVNFTNNNEENKLCSNLSYYKKDYSLEISNFDRLDKSQIFDNTNINVNRKSKNWLNEISASNINIDSRNITNKHINNSVKHDLSCFDRSSQNSIKYSIKKTKNNKKSPPKSSLILESTEMHKLANRFFENPHEKFEKEIVNSLIKGNSKEKTLQIYNLSQQLVNHNKKNRIKKNKILIEKKKLSANTPIYSNSYNYENESDQKSIKKQVKNNKKDSEKNAPSYIDYRHKNTKVVSISNKEELISKFIEKNNKLNDNILFINSDKVEYLKNKNKTYFDLDNKFNSEEASESDLDNDNDNDNNNIDKESIGKNSSMNKCNSIVKLTKKDSIISNQKSQGSGSLLKIKSKTGILTSSLKDKSASPVRSFKVELKDFNDDVFENSSFLKEATIPKPKRTSQINKNNENKNSKNLNSKNTAKKTTKYNNILNKGNTTKKLNLDVEFLDKMKDEQRNSVNKERISQALKLDLINNHMDIINEGKETSSKYFGFIKNLVKKNTRRKSLTKEFKILNLFNADENYRSICIRNCTKLLPKVNENIDEVELISIKYNIVNYRNYFSDNYLTEQDLKEKLNEITCSSINVTEENIEDKLNQDNKVEENSLLKTKNKEKLADEITIVFENPKEKVDTIEPITNTKRSSNLNIMRSSSKFKTKKSLSSDKKLKILTKDSQRTLKNDNSEKKLRDDFESSYLNQAVGSLSKDLNKTGVSAEVSSFLRKVKENFDDSYDLNQSIIKVPERKNTVEETNLGEDYNRTLMTELYIPEEKREVLLENKVNDKNNKLSSSINKLEHDKKEWISEVYNLLKSNKKLDEDLSDDYNNYNNYYNTATVKRVYESVENKNVLSKAKMVKHTNINYPNDVNDYISKRISTTTKAKNKEQLLKELDEELLILDYLMENSNNELDSKLQKLKLEYDNVLENDATIKQIITANTNNNIDKFKNENPSCKELIQTVIEDIEKYNCTEKEANQNSRKSFSINKTILEKIILKLIEEYDNLEETSIKQIKSLLYDLNFIEKQINSYDKECKELIIEEKNKFKRQNSDINEHIRDSSFINKETISIKKNLGKSNTINYYNMNNNNFEIKAKENHKASSSVVSLKKVDEKAEKMSEKQNNTNNFTNSLDKALKSSIKETKFSPTLSTKSSFDFSFFSDNKSTFNWLKFV